MNVNNRSIYFSKVVVVFTCMGNRKPKLLNKFMNKFEIVGQENEPSWNII